MLLNFIKSWVTFMGLLFLVSGAYFAVIFLTELAFKKAGIESISPGVIAFGMFLLYSMYTAYDISKLKKNRKDI